MLIDHLKLYITSIHPRFQQITDKILVQSFDDLKSWLLWSYLIFVSNAVSVKILAECKKIPEKNKKITALGSVYVYLS